MLNAGLKTQTRARVERANSQLCVVGKTSFRIDGPAGSAR